MLPIQMRVLHFRLLQCKNHFIICFRNVYRYRIWFNGQLMKLYTYRVLHSYLYVLDFDIVPVVTVAEDTYSLRTIVLVSSAAVVCAKTLRKKYGFGKAFSIGTIKGKY